MRTLLFLLAGSLLAALVLGLARYLGPAARSLSAALAGFAVLWFAVAAANLWVGVNRAGYALREELPIFLLIFLVPVAVAALIRRRPG